MPLKYLLMLVAFSAFSNQVFSQYFQFGGLVGINYSFQSVRIIEGNNLSTTEDSSLGFNINAHIGYKSNGIFGASIEPGFNKLVFSFVSPSGGFSYITSYNYFNTPLLADIYLKKMFFSIGPEFNFLLNATQTNKADLSKTDLEELSERFSYSLIFGYNYILSEKVDIGIRYSHGLGHIKHVSYTTPEGFPVGEYKFYNNYLALIFRWSFKNK